ncbi:hypothetical protein AB6A40_003462 [Gnathostoma spinigerum]|uniref:Uncharacterized protein n=1 Tax=Gnathostoma spinigerum TaxID=75299 RepID=A0ABD6EIG3_9BILA
MGSAVCPQSFTWECDEPSCCESYHFRVMILFATLGLLAAALLVAAVWMTYEFRPSYRKKFRRASPRNLRDMQRQSFEETKYLRRMSENNTIFHSTRKY